ncbi:uncharacterized protein LTR77_009302 [Saxophila tyrrhenica]|uniref:Zn(2)-C6 fungal-type domain-containing protein n=1 Tax=Saxophila tyrrhenica TaxID=1690608 RepID=A0AAV9NYU8_9PEZI|nr:hypothetical protein LTR77_009302 [Saxophila tyrrhenica]
MEGLSAPSDPPEDSVVRHEAGAVAANPRKRPRGDRTGLTYARKRAVTACELCRLRKTKCDNQRPTCGTCAAFGADCTFKDRETDHSTFDQASLAILDRLNYAIQLLEDPPGSRNAPATATTDPGSLPHHELSSINTYASDNGHGGSNGAVDGVNAAAADALTVNTRCACTHVIDWPIFAGRINPASISPGLSDSPSIKRGSSARISEGDVDFLVRDFLNNVHVKNPILDRGDLLDFTRTIAEEGFKWDSSSCLVLIACALGSLSTSWEAAVPSASETSLDDAKSYMLAEAYYTAARKRLGLLENTAQATQCWFLAGVYEMYSMRPLTGWTSFNRACALLQPRLYLQSQSTPHSFGQSDRRLYWSCLKSETELREEFDLPPPGLAQMEHPDVLPSPPESAAHSGTGGIATDGVWESMQEKSWYYYLSDIAYRRIANRTVGALYCVPKEEWLSMPVRQLQRIAEELDAQVVQLWDHIPGSPSSAPQIDTDELTYMLYLDYADLRERIWRPFLYIAVHGQVSEADQLIVMAGANKCLDTSFVMLEKALLKHRHHGCWQTIRCMITKALLVLAAAKSRRGEIRSDWRSVVRSFQAYLQYWETEAPDLGAARSALSTLVAEID